MTRADEPEKPPEPKLPEAKPPGPSAHTNAGKAAREQRLAAEMRTNLKKRKAQARAQRERGKPD
jgi:hypothetical protein